MSCDNNFESSLKKLEEIVAKLEQGNATLDESIKLFEEGIELSKYCSKCLDNAKQKIVSLSEAERGENTDD